MKANLNCGAARGFGLFTAGLVATVGDEPIDLRVQLVMDVGRLTRAKATAVLAALAGAPGPIERQVRDDVRALGQLSGSRRSYAEMAYRMARALDADSDEITSLSGASRELRGCLVEIWKGVKVERPSDRAVAGLATPHGGRP